jgi:hypothetical protein
MEDEPYVAGLKVVKRSGQIFKYKVGTHRHLSRLVDAELSDPDTQEFTVIFDEKGTRDLFKRGS